MNSDVEIRSHLGRLQAHRAWRMVCQLYGLKGTVSVTNKARLLGVSISTDLTFDQHVTSVSGQCFYQLRQLRGAVRHSLDTESITTLIRAFVSSRVNYCCSLLIWVTAFSHRQASARPQCSCPCYNQHQEVWERVITDTVSRPSLAGWYWTDSVPSGRNSISVSARHCSSVPDWTVYACHCVSKSSWRSSVRHNQHLGRTTLQTVNLRHPCVQCRWSSLLECFTGLVKVIRSSTW